MNRHPLPREAPYLILGTWSLFWEIKANSYSDSFVEMASEPIIGSSVDNDGGGTSVDSNNVNCGAFCLLTSDRTSLGNDASRKLALQKVLKSTGSDVLEVQTLRNTNKTLAKLDYPSNGKIYCICTLSYTYCLATVCNFLGM